MQHTYIAVKPEFIQSFKKKKRKESKRKKKGKRKKGRKGERKRNNLKK